MKQFSLGKAFVPTVGIIALIYLLLPIFHVIVFSFNDAGRNNITWRWDDLWATDLSRFDVVYAFLSPVPMPRLWEKVQKEMPPGSLFISNSFPVPGVTPDRVIEVPCTPARPLYCYQR